MQGNSGMTAFDFDICRDMNSLSWLIEHQSIVSIMISISSYTGAKFKADKNGLSPDINTQYIHIA